MALFSLLVFAAVAPFAKRALAQISAFFPIYQSDSAPGRGTTIEASIPVAANLL